MTSLSVNKIFKATEQLQTINQQLHFAKIDNYYGAHKNFKTDFRNKKYKNVYSQLIHRRPSQPEHKALYYQDVLISIIKIIQHIFLSKENIHDSIEPFFYFGVKAINQFYWLFLKQKRIIDSQIVIDPNMSSNISNFMTLVVDFCSKIGQYLAINGNSQNSERILNVCYENIVSQVISTSTSNILLLKKCGQFLLHYAIKQLTAGQLSLAHTLIKDGLKTQLNQLIIIKYSLNRRQKLKKYSKRFVSALKLLKQFYLCLAYVYEKQNKSLQCATAVLDTILVEDLIASYSQEKGKTIISNLKQVYLEEKNKYLEVARICHAYFPNSYLKQIQGAKIQNSAKQNFSRKQFTMRYAPNNPSSILPSYKLVKFFHTSNLISNANANANNFYPNLKSDIRQVALKKGRQNKKQREPKHMKEVRFKLENENALHEEKNQPFIKNDEGIISSGYSYFNQVILSQTSSVKNMNGSAWNPQHDNKQTSDGINHVQQKQKQTSNKNQRDPHKLISDQFILFGENFWKPQEQKVVGKRSISTLQRLKNKEQFQIKQQNRKLSYKGFSYVEINTSNSNANKMATDKSNISLYLKQNYKQSGIKKSKKREANQKIFKRINFENPDNYAKVSEKMKNWHKKSAKMETDMLYRVQKLKQKKNSNIELQNTEQGKEIETERQKQWENSKQFCNSTLKHDEEKQKQLGSYKKGKKVNGVKLFKNFLLQNKSYFNITKCQLFQSNGQSQYGNRFQSILLGDNLQKNESVILQKNHWLAKNSIDFFLKQISNSNERLSKHQKQSKPNYSKRKSTSACHIQKRSNPAINIDTPPYENYQHNPCNLFATSLKSRAAQMVAYL